MAREAKEERAVKGREIAIYETDVQNDFSLKSGSLFVHGFEEESSWKPYGAESRLPMIRDIHSFAKEQGYFILGSVDRHFYEDAELIRNQGGSFHDHCMNGTWGQLRVDGLERQQDIYVQSKGGPGLDVRTYKAGELEEIEQVAVRSGAHIVFEKQSYDVSTNPNFAPLVEELIRAGLKIIALNGFATEYCVKAAALALLDSARTAGLVPGRDFLVFLVSDAIHPVNIDFAGKKNMEFGKEALELLYSRGVLPVTTEELLQGRLEEELQRLHQEAAAGGEGS